MSPTIDRCFAECARNNMLICDYVFYIIFFEVECGIFYLFPVRIMFS